MTHSAFSDGVHGIHLRIFKFSLRGSNGQPCTVHRHTGCSCVGTHKDFARPSDFTGCTSKCQLYEGMIVRFLTSIIYIDTPFNKETYGLKESITNVILWILKCMDTNCVYTNKKGWAKQWWLFEEDHLRCSTSPNFSPLMRKAFHIGT